MQPPTYKILLLHAAGCNARRTVLDHIYCYPQYRPGNLYAYHHLLAPVSTELLAFPFDAVIIDYTFLAYRTTNLYPQLRQKYRFLTDTNAKKIVISQDEFNGNEILDEWLQDLKVDVIYTPVERDLDVLLPVSNKSVPIKNALAGYSHSQDLLQLKRFARPFDERSIDVGTRVRFPPPNYGRAGILKGQTAERFRDAARAAGFVTDISTDPNDVFLGEDWFRFLGSCRFTYATRGGVSMCDPRGDIGRRVAAYREANPDASFDAIEAACFAGQDRYDFSTPTPRLFEATALQTGLILLEDHYFDGVEPYRHYIPLKPDFSNLDEVFTLMRDDAAVKRMIGEAYHYLVDNDRFSYRAFVDMVLSEVETAGPPRPAAANDFAGLMRHYEKLAASQRLVMEAPAHWSKIVRFAGNRAQKQGQLPSLAELVGAVRAGTDIRSIAAAEIASGGHLDTTLTGLAIEAIAGLADEPRDLDALASLFADASQVPGTDNFHRDWAHCEYVYDPSSNASPEAGSSPH